MRTKLSYMIKPAYRMNKQVFLSPLAAPHDSEPPKS